ncbi:MAG: hypothetical protein NZ516_13240, partial [Raineya sp.]|nr:hypothetical protein [Raineya sp.]
TLPLVPCRDENDEFIFSSGRTAVVFKMQHKERGTLHALKCFTQLHPETFQRSRAISRYLQNNPASYFVNYLALDEELWVQDRFLPVICMDWIEGETLAQYLRRLIEANDAYPIFHLALSFDRLALWLLEQPFAHGDLKTDNILITPQGNLILVDYETTQCPLIKVARAYS